MNYEIHGEFRIEKTARFRIDRDRIEEFWEQTEASREGLSNASGCYVYGVRSSGGERVRPWYVGKTAASFRRECFQPHKILYFEDALADYVRGQPYMFLLPRITETGRLSNNVNAGDIDFLEKYLIGIGLKANPDLLNKRDTNIYRDLYVPGIVNQSRGHPGASARRLKNCLRV